MSGLPRQLLRALGLLLAVSALAIAAHLSLTSFCRIQPPTVAPQGAEPTRETPRLRTLGASAVIERAGLFEAHLRGTPTQIGWAHARLFYPEMVENEGVLLTRLEKAVPVSFLRTLLLDVAQFRYRHIAEGMSAERRNEIAAAALGFQPDPYQGLFPTFQRFSYLNALYDIALSFEHSPLIGCTTFVFSGPAAGGSGSLLARNFDFEVDPIFDRKKAVFFVHESGKIPFASVAWPGLVGVVSGMNREGVAMVVHGGRAGEPRSEGEPVVHALRAALSLARTSEDAVRVLSARTPLVSHIVIVTDASGRALEIERIPGQPDHVVPLGHAAAVTNHFTGPSASDPKNLSVLSHTSTRERKARADELVARAPRPMTAADAVTLLRDRRGVGDRALQLGDRNAIDALIATHGVVMDTSARRLWVSLAPHLLGPFVAFDLARMLADDYRPDPELQLDRIAADPTLAPAHPAL